MPSERSNYEENVYIRLSDDGGVQARIMNGDVLSIDVMCTNGNIPSSMNIGAPDGDFDCDIDIANLRITALKPSIKNVACYGLKRHELENYFSVIS